MGRYWKDAFSIREASILLREGSSAALSMLPGPEWEGSAVLCCTCVEPQA